MAYTIRAHAAVSGGSLSPDTPFSNVGQFIGIAINTIVIISGLALFAYLLYGAFTYITSQGDKIRVEKAQQTLTYAFLGLVIVVASFAIITIVEKVFGIRILSGISLPRP